MTSAARLSAAIAGGLLVAVSATTAAVPPARVASPPDISGTWQGRYDCAQGATGLTLTFSADGRGGWTGTFRFFALKENPSVPGGAFGVVALYDKAENSFHVDPRFWIEQPFGYVTVPLVGEVAEDGQAFAGEVLTEGCGKFLVKRFLS